jgi:hypothetical protein
MRLRPSISLLLTFRLSTALLAVGLSALGWTTFDWDTALNISLAVLAGIVVVQTASAYLWASRYFGVRVESDIPPTNVHADAAKVSITTQGVVLGLVSFSESSKLAMTVKVGSAALATGVVLATILYLQVAGSPPADQKRAVAASILLSLTFWSLSFGLVCIVAGNWSR